MIQIRKACDRGHARHGWLDNCHTFTFADYHNPQHMGFRSLQEGDGSAISHEARLSMVADSPAEMLVFDLA